MKKQATLTLRLDQNLRDFLDERSAQLRLSRAEIVRLIVEDFIAQSPPPKVVKLEDRSADLVKNLAQEIRRLGVNLNQALKLAHIGKLSPTSEVDWQFAIDDLERLRRLSAKVQVRGGVTYVDHEG